MNDLRCSVQSAALEDSPLGTAGHDNHYLLVELPLPWPRKIEEHPLLAGLDDPSDTRILALLSDRPSDPGRHRIIAYRGGDGLTFAHFTRHEAVVEQSQLAGVIARALEGDLSDLVALDDSEHDHGLTDVLICTHGTRDRCCGTEGARLFLDLVAIGNPAVRLWRTSHTGGHRFAPIALTFPDGYTWGRVNAEQLLGMIDHTVSPDDLLAHNRGCMGFAEPEAQAADAVALAAFGWNWLATERSAHIASGHDGPECTVIVENGSGRVEATIQRGDPIPVPICGEPLENAQKSTTPLRLVSAEVTLD